MVSYLAFIWWISELPRKTDPPTPELEAVSLPVGARPVTNGASSMGFATEEGSIDKAGTVRAREQVLPQGVGGGFR
jgi:hypothetical protein